MGIFISLTEEELVNLRTPLKEGEKKVFGIYNDRIK